MKSMKRKVLTVGLSILVSSTAMALEPTPNPAAAAATFDSLFPYYTLECSLTQLQPIDGEPGGTGGHVLMFIKGIARDTSYPYPRLKMLDEAADLSNPDLGVTLSADKILENTEYLATDGQSFMFNGDLKPGEAVDATTLARTRDVVVRSGTLKGVKVHPEYLAKKPAGMTDEEYIAQIGADTDYAISFAREANCVRIPMTRSQIQAEVDFVNESNEPYVTGKKIYNWNGPGDNCTNFTHDVLAAAGIRKYVNRTANKLKGIFNILTMQIQVPRNETLGTEEAVNKVQKIGTAEEVFNDEDRKATFDRLGTLAETGGVFQVVPMNLTGNKLYRQAPGAMMLDTPLIMNRKKALKKVETESQFTDLAENLQSVRDRLAQVQKKRTQILEADHSELAEFSRKYNAWVDQTIVSLDQKLALLSN